MKKLLITALAAAIAALAGTASAQEFQPIGYAHSVSFGAAYGYGSAPLANFASGMVDINLPGAKLPKYSYFRTRIELNGDGLTAGFAASLGAGFQYMQHIAAGLYVYPFVQVKGELHSSAWPKKADFTPGAGAGLEYQFSSNIGLFVQGAYDYALIEGSSRPAAKVGLVFAFGGKAKANSFEAKKQKLAGVVESNAAQARAARQAAKAAAQREEAERIAADKMRKEAAEQAVAAEKARKEAAQQAAEQMFEDTTVQNAYVEYQAGKPSAISVPFVMGESNVGNTSRTKILGLVPYLLSNPSATVEIMAYGDKLTEKADANLAAKREKAVRDILTSAGIAAERIVAGQPSAAQSATTQPGSVAIVKINAY